MRRLTISVGVAALLLAGSACGANKTHPLEEVEGCSLPAGPQAWECGVSADLEGVDLTDADLTDADMRYNNLPGASLTAANLTQRKLVRRKPDWTQT